MAKGVKFVWNKKPSKIVDRFCNDEKVGLFVAETWMREMDEYVPMDTGMLAQNVITEPFKVIYTSVYAHRQYTGENFNFSDEMHPNATSYWDRATYNAKSNKIAKQIENYFERM